MPHFEHDGHRLFYREQGEGPALLLLPGNTASSAHHEGELAYYGQKHRAISLDFWGTGASDRLPRWPDDWFDLAAADAAALIEHLGVGPCLVMGTSGGSAVALLVAITYPHLVCAVVADSFVPYWQPEWLQREVANRLPGTPGQVAFWRQGHGDDWRRVVAADGDMLLRLADRGGDVLSERLSQVRCPALFTASLRDESLPDVARQVPEMVLQVTGSVAYLTGEGSHPLMWSRPDVFRRAADCFVAGLGE
ncbi:MAG: alpha/beta fold hydrolase [Anaerolineae bacterium]